MTLQENNTFGENNSSSNTTGNNTFGENNSSSNTIGNITFGENNSSTDNMGNSLQKGTSPRNSMEDSSTQKR